MPKNLIATDLAVEALRIRTDEAGAVTGLTATINVAYSDTRAGRSSTYGPFSPPPSVPISKKYMMFSANHCRTHTWHSSAGS